MKKLLLPVILALLSFAVNAQVIDNFDATATDSTYQLSIENGEVSHLILTPNTTDKMEG